VNVAYLMNSYPMTSTTFIRREIEALEHLGLNIDRYAVRAWTSELVDPRDIVEKQRTHYLLTGNVMGLVAALIREIAFNLPGVMRAGATWIKLLKNAGWQTFIKHVAYFMEAVYFLQLAELKCVDHVHVHFSTNAAAVALLARRMGGPSYSFTVHGPDELVELEELSFAIKIRFADFVVAISNYCRNELARAAQSEKSKIIVARCALAMEDFDDSDLVRSYSDALVCVGRLCPQKGQVLIPAAAAELRKEFPNLKIILVGDGESRSAVETAIATYDVADVVKLHGWVANKEVLALIKSSRALLLPSYAEGLPVVIMEALALGRPVISTTIAGIPELVDESCGWLFPPGDQKALVAAIRAALICQPSDLARMGKSGRERTLRLHDRRDLAIALSNQFKRAAGNATTSPS
jgi:colanic acid/amylovoran biosynthesis glycosyltransferase